MSCSNDQNKHSPRAYALKRPMKTMTPMTAASRPKLWRNDITGLRALAVLPVLIFHAFPSLIPGGFFGVDVFFVISGYLISGIIFRGIASGSFSYIEFYEKRIKRIIPNLILLLTFVAAVGWFILLPDEYANLGMHIDASTLFIQNFQLLSEIGYFTEDALRKPLLHLWSLAIEEQFYIVFPLICTLIWRLSRSVKMIGIAAALIALGSLAACLSSSDRNFAFYFPLTRFWELGAGILLSYSETFIGFSTSRFSQNVRNGLSIAGVLMIVLPMAFAAESAAHPGLITLIPVLGAVLVIAAEPDALFNRTLLCWRPMTFVGLISYSLYLWHWPLLAYLFIAVPDATPSVLTAALALSFVIAALVYFYVENPIRRCRNSGKAVLLLLAGLVLMLALGETIRQTDGFPQRPLKFEDKVISVRAENEWDGFEKAPRFKYEGVDIATPNPNAFPSLIFIGDSHMAQYYLRAQRLSEREHVNFGMIAKAGWFLFNDQRMGDYARAVKAIVADKRVHTLVIGSMWGGKIKEEEFYQVAATVRPLLETRKDLKVYVMLDYPWTPNVGGQQGIYDPLKHVNRITGDAVGMVQPFPAADDWKRGNEEIQRILGDAAEYIDPTPIVCPGQKCNLQAWYRDDDHLQPKRIEADSIWVDRIFEHAAAAESKERSR